MNSDIECIDQSEIMSKAIAIIEGQKAFFLLVWDGESVKDILSVKELLVYSEKWFKLTLLGNIKKRPAE
jgi:hypothetical protein